MAAVGTGIAGFLYAVSFIYLRNPALSALFLALQGFIAIPVMVALYEKAKTVDAKFALVTLIFGIIGSVGLLVHGGYDLANVFNPPASVNLDLPNQIDPRGLLAFGITGIAVLKFSWLLNKVKGYAGGFVTLGVISGLLLIVIYLARLTILSPASPVLLYPVLIEGFVVNPVWYLWLGTILSSKKG